jgi:hypothetical protein
VTHTVFIDLDSHVATASATGTAAPDLPLKHLTKQTLAFAFHSSGTVTAVTGWSTGRVVIKATPTSDVLLLDTTLAATGSTTSTRYSAEWAAVDCDSAALRTLIGASVEPLDVFAEIQWTADSGTHAVAFPIQIVPTFNLPEDDPPDPTEEASWTWLKARLAAGSNITFTDNDTTQVRTIAASGGGGGGGGSVDWGDIGGTLSDQTDLQTALNNKQPLASALTTLSSATAAGLALMDDADNAAQRTTLGLGNASTLNVGTTAGTVAAGDDSRLSDARTPTAHAASHITGGSDAIQSATASQNGLATAAQITKLDGIEALADVTDAGNVGAAIHGATAKTTPVDADTVSLIDSAASNVLKKVTWANIKATLKTYLDPFYLLKSVYDPQNAGRISGADGADVEDYGGAPGGAGGTLSMDGGPATSFMESPTAGGAAGSINTSGGIGDGGQFSGSGGNINTSGGSGVNGGDINTTAGGSITTGVGNVNLGNTSGTLDPHALSPLPAIALRIPIFFSDQTTDWTTGLKVTFTWRFGTTTLSSTPIDCVTAPTGSAAQFDVKKNGTTIYSTKPTIDAGETSTGTAATPAVFSTTSLDNGDIVTIWIDQIGSTIKGQGGVLTFVGSTIP